MKMLPVTAEAIVTYLKISKTSSGIWWVCFFKWEELAADSWSGWSDQETVS